MPSYATCHIFAATVQRVTSDAVAHIIDSAPSAYRWGAQGVSPLRMYHAPLPSPLHHAAAELRTQPPARLFEALCRAACAAHNTAALAYVFGFCTNYALSRVTSRFIDEQADRLATYMPGLSAAARRQLAASDIDGIMIEDYIDTASADYAAYRLLDADAPECTAAARVLAQAVHATLGTHVSLPPFTAACTICGIFCGLHMAARPCAADCRSSSICSEGAAWPPRLSGRRSRLRRTVRIANIVRGRVQTASARNRSAICSMPLFPLPFRSRERFSIDISRTSRLIRGFSPRILMEIL